VLKKPAGAMAGKSVDQSTKAVASRTSGVMKRPAGAASSKLATAPPQSKRSRTSVAEKPVVVEKPRAAPKAKAVEEEAQETPLANLKALMVGLARRPDRRQRCEDMLKEQVPWLQCTFFNGTDGKNETIPDEEVSQTWNTKNNSLYGAYEDVFDKQGALLHSAAEFASPGVDYAFSPGERGCAHSHYRIWKHVAEAEHPVLVLEDDVQLVFERSAGGMASGATFTTRLEKAMVEVEGKEPDVLYLGWSGFRDGNYKHHTTSRGRKSSLVRKAEYVWTTVAYVLWPAGAKKLLEAAQPMNQPVDNFMAWECREGRLAAYVVLDEGDDNSTWSGGIVTQHDFENDSDVRKSDGGDQGHDPTEFLAKASTGAADAEKNVEAAHGDIQDASNDAAAAAENVNAEEAGEEQENDEVPQDTPQDTTATPEADAFSAVAANAQDCANADDDVAEAPDAVVDAADEAVNAEEEEEDNHQAAPASEENDAAMESSVNPEDDCTRAEDVQMEAADEEEEAADETAVNDEEEEAQVDEAQEEEAPQEEEEVDANEEEHLVNDAVEASNLDGADHDMQIEHVAAEPDF